MTNDERRQHQRYPRELKVTYSILSSEGATPFEFGDCITLDISRSGVRLCLNEKINVPVLIQMNIRVPERSYGIFILGKVVFCGDSEIDEFKGMHEAGVKFVGLLPPDFADTVGKFISDDEDFDCPA